MLLGSERAYQGRAAGMRTYGLVCMASCALTVFSGYSHFWWGSHLPAGLAPDPTRVIQGIVSGIGFLGAGVIMKDGFTISGLSTAASIWMCSAIGILIGVLPLNSVIQSFNNLNIGTKCSKSMAILFSFVTLLTVTINSGTLS